MKICVISPGVVHAVPRTVAIAKHFERVHFIDMVGSADRGVLESHGVSYHLPAEGGVSRLGSLNLQRLLRRIAPDAIVCHFASGDHFFNAVAYGRCPVAVVAMGHDVLYEHGNEHVPAARRMLTRMGLRRVNYVSAKSGYLADRIRSYGVRCPVDVNFWGADLEHFRPIDRTLARQALGFPDRVPIILSPRAVEPRLNIHLIVEAFPKVLERFPDALLVIVGRSAAAYRNRVERRIADLGLKSSIRLFDEVGQTVLPTYYNASDVVVSVAASEGFPNTLLEVMACRIPIVVGRIPQVQELLEDGRNARICGIDPAAISSAVVATLKKPDDAAAMADSAWQTAVAEGDINKNGARFAARLKEILRNPLRYRDRWVYPAALLAYLSARKLNSCTNGS